MSVPLLHSKTCLHHVRLLGSHANPEQMDAFGKGGETTSVPWRSVSDQVTGCQGRVGCATNPAMYENRSRWSKLLDRPWEGRP
jgi:hypothetical protein